MSVIIPSAGIILAGTYAEDSPTKGLDAALELFVYAEQLGFDIAGIRQRHLERGVSSALPFLAAASQRTRTITLESDVIPLGHGAPFRIAEDAALVDALSGGRLHLGVSTATPHADLLASFAVGGPYSPSSPYEPVDVLLRALEGQALSDEPLETPYGAQIPRIQPHVPTLRERVWLGGGSLRSVRWAAARGLALLLGNVAAGEGAVTFERAQRTHVDEYLEHHTGTASPAVGVERVIIPTDSATAAQREHYASYAATREDRTQGTVDVGGRRLVFHRDLHGTVDEIVDRLADDEVFDGRTQLRVALPYGFAVDEYRQIFDDIRHGVLPALGWRPATAPVG